MIKTLYFGNLPWAVTPEDLEAAVSQLHGGEGHRGWRPIGRRAAAGASASWKCPRSRRRL